MVDAVEAMQQTTRLKLLRKMPTDDAALFHEF
jgi:hypothetical protein